MIKIKTTKNLIISSSVFCFFLLFLVSWINDGGAWVFGLYSEVDGQFAAWFSKFSIDWAKPFAMSNVNPFQGMGSLFMPMNSWWDPGAYVLNLIKNNVISYSLAYSIYWVEIFFSTYFLAKTTGLKKIESILAAEVFVLIFFPPFSAFFKTVPFFSLAPMFAYWISLIIMMSIAYIKLGEGGFRFNLFLVAFLILASFLLIMTSGPFFILLAFIYAFYVLGFIIRNINQRQVLWKIGVVLFLSCLFLMMHGFHFYKDTFNYLSAVVDVPNAPLSFSTPKTLVYHTSILFADRPFFIFFHILALAGGFIGLFYQQGKYKWIAVSFLLIALIPDSVTFLIENNIVSGGNTGQVNAFYYLWIAYPIYCIFFIICISFFCRLLVFMLSPLGKIFPSNIMKWIINKNSNAHIIFSYGLKLLILITIPLVTFIIYWNNFAHADEALKKPNKTAIVGYLEKQIGLKPGDVFRGATISYFASKNSPIANIIKTMDPDINFNPNKYILTREFLNKRYGNRYMFSDLWNFNIPTLEEYGHMVALPMYVYFKNMLAEDHDVTNRHFLNVYKINLKALQALGARYIISDQVLSDKNLSLVMIQKMQDYQIPFKDNYVDYDVLMSSRNIFEELEQKYKKSIITRDIFNNEFNKKLNQRWPSMQQDKEKLNSYLDTSITSALGVNYDPMNWSFITLEKIKSYYNVATFNWVASPTLYLYEIKNSNLATFSPTVIIKVDSAKEMFDRMARPNFSFDESAIVQDRLPVNIASRLVKVKNSEMRFERNVVHVKAESAGWSLLLLPLQYSHCYRLTEMHPSPSQEPVRLIRADLVHEALLFKNKADIELNFDFGIGKNVYCRKKDIEDMQSLGLI